MAVHDGVAVMVSRHNNALLIVAAVVVGNSQLWLGLLVGEVAGILPLMAFDYKLCGADDPGLQDSGWQVMLAICMNWWSLRRQLV